MKTPAPPAFSRLSQRSVTAAAMLAVLMAMDTDSAAAIGEPSAQIDLSLARIDARHAVVALITVNSPIGVAMQGDIRVFDRGRELAVIPVSSTGAISLAIPVAKDTAQYVAICVKIEGELLYAADVPQAFQASDCAMLEQDQPPPRVPVRPGTIPQPSDVLAAVPSGRR